LLFTAQVSGRWLVADDLLFKLVQAAIMIAMGAAMFARAGELYSLSKAIEGGEASSASAPGWWRLFPFKFLGMTLICAGGVGAYHALLS
jgi:hypothetical protein